MSTFNETDIRAMRKNIMEVELEPVHQMPGRTDMNASTIGFINAGAIQVFKNSLPPQQKADAQNWILFGQLAADKAAENDGYSRVSDPERWYQTFIGFLNRVGMRSGGYTRKQAESDEIDENAAQTALKLLKHYFTKEDQVLVDRVFHDLRLPLNATALRTFNEAASHESGANFLVLGASVDRFLNLTIHLTCLDFHTEEPIEHDNMLYWNWNKDNVKCYYGRDTLTLPKNLADRIRPTLLQKIEGIREHHIIPILG